MSAAAARSACRRTSRRHHAAAVHPGDGESWPVVVFDLDCRQVNARRQPTTIITRRQHGEVRSDAAYDLHEILAGGCGRGKRGSGAEDGGRPTARRPLKTIATAGNSLQERVHPEQLVAGTIDS